MSDVFQVETTLFYQSNEALDLSKIAQWLHDAFAETQIGIRPKYRSACDLAFAVGGLTLTIAHSPQPLDLTPFGRAKSPLTHFGLPHDIQRDLTAHRSAFVIRVTGPKAAARRETRLAVCYIAALPIIGGTSPDLIHWAASNTVYTFDQLCAQVDEDPATLVPAASDTAMPPNARPGDHAKAINALRAYALRQFAFPASAIRVPRKAASKAAVSRALLQSAVIAISLPAGADALIAPVLRVLALG